MAVTWELGEHVYGRGLHAAFSQEGKPVARAAEFFQVATVEDWWRTNMLNGGGLCDRATRATDPFVTYGNFDNHFAYALSDFSHLAPEPEVYYSGQTQYHIRKTGRIAKVRARRALGILAGAYTLGNTGGAAGYELARRHPEWFLRDERGGVPYVQSARLADRAQLPARQRPKGWYVPGPGLRQP